MYKFSSIVVIKILCAIYFIERHQTHHKSNVSIPESLSFSLSPSLLLCYFVSSHLVPLSIDIMLMLHTISHSWCNEYNLNCWYVPLIPFPSICVETLFFILLRFTSSIHLKTNATQYPHIMNKKRGVIFAGYKKKQKKNTKLCAIRLYVFFFLFCQIHPFTSFSWFEYQLCIWENDSKT